MQIKETFFWGERGVDNVGHIFWGVGEWWVIFSYFFLFNLFYNHFDCDVLSIVFVVLVILSAHFERLRGLLYSGLFLLCYGSSFSTL